MSEGLSVDIVDDDEGVRRTLGYMLASAGYAARLHQSAEAFLERPRGGTCLLADVRLPGLSGLELVRRLRGEAWLWPIIVMSGAGDIDMAVEAMKLGAVDFLQKPLRAAAVLGAVREAVTREAPRARLAEQASASRRAIERLTPRQRDVLAGVVAGKLNKTIAHELGISVRTVEGYRTELMAKAQAGSVSELVRLAILAGF